MKRVKRSFSVRLCSETAHNEPLPTISDGPEVVYLWLKPQMSVLACFVCVRRGLLGTTLETWNDRAAPEWVERVFDLPSVSRVCGLVIILIYIFSIQNVI